MKLFKGFIKAQPKTTNQLIEGGSLKKPANLLQLPIYQPCQYDEQRRLTLSLLASAIAGAERQDTQLVIQTIREKNPEAQLVMLIASVVAAEKYPQSHFVVRNIFMCCE